MNSIPSIGIIEIMVLAGVAGVVLLAGGLVLVIVAKARRGRRTQTADYLGPVSTGSRPPKLGVWLLLLGLVAALALPLIVIAGGILIVTPVKSERAGSQGLDPQVHVVTESTPEATALAATPEPTSPVSAGPVEPPPSEQPSLSIRPDDNMLYVMLPAFAGLTVLVSAVILAVIRTRWQDGGALPQEAGETSRGKSSRRYVLLALAIWSALSIFLVLDVSFAVSVYWQFLAVYASFWVLVGALLLIGSPRREKLLILGLFAVALFSIRLVDWNSRKPFLKDFYRVREGMTVEQVEQIMGDYKGGGCRPESSTGLPAGGPATEPEEPAAPERMVYRHTDEGWGNSDWGEITFEKGRVVQTQFLPD